MSRDRAARPGQGVFYGWYVVAAVFVLFTAASGLTTYGLSIYLHAFVAEGRFSIEQVSFASGAFSAAGGLVGAVVGRLLDRWDVRWVITAGAALMLAAVLSLPWVRSLPALYAFYIVMGVGYGTAALIPGTTLIARWFSDRRSTALSIAATGNSFGAVTLVPPAALLVAQLGLDGASSWIALALALGTLLPTWLVLRSWPRDKGCAALGEAPSSGQGAPTPPAASAEAYRRAVGTRYFKGVCIAFMLGMAAHMGGQAHLFNRLMEQGVGTGFASLAISAMAASSVFARFGAVWALRRMSTRNFMALLLGVQGLALWGCGLGEHPAWLLACILLFGSTLGNFVTVQSLVLAEAFGVAAYARLYGTSRVWGVPGALLGPGVMGWIYQQTGDYLGAYLMIGAVSLAGIAALRMAGHRL